MPTVSVPKSDWQEFLEIRLLSAATGETLLRLPKVDRSCELGVLKVGFGWLWRLWVLIVLDTAFMEQDGRKGGTDWYEND